jgi:acetylxylan esterase
MAATYPDLFKAGSAYAGVAAGCFYTGIVAGWNSTCSGGQSIASQEAWAQTARNMYPGYTGSRPRMMIYHGSADSTIFPQVRTLDSSRSNQRFHTTPPPLELQRDAQAMGRLL